jgi:hypothetical protein
MLPTRGIRHGWFHIDSIQSNLVPVTLSVGLVRQESDRHDLIPQPLCLIFKYNQQIIINVRKVIEIMRSYEFLIILW